ncbi:casein kinase II subunit beta [Nematocida displodere]|uniref:Casein kinase II subunit beta n=1 Tax=Nematocida displodere TaxID=1805483 RepID=A0A177EE55_9MICR|nr:casein kinase II subunit beta [Nematocida displodere]
MFSSSSEEYESSGSMEEWSDAFLKQFPYPFLIKVDQSFIDDSFNLFGLSDIVKDYDRALAALRGEEESYFIENETVLYLLIHQRYILSKQGIEEILPSITKNIYGRCKRVLCASYPLIPTGLNDYPGYANVKLFCNQCTELYEPAGPLAEIDGCAFGRTFSHLLLLQHGDALIPRTRPVKYLPRIFGFQVERH